MGVLCTAKVPNFGSAEAWSNDISESRHHRSTDTQERIGLATKKSQYFF